MKDEIKEIKIKTIGQLLDYVETEQKAKELINYITNLQEENERLKKSNENASKVCLAEHRYGVDKAEEARDYKLRNEKAIRYIERCRDYHRNIHKEERIFPDEITSLLMVLNGGDE